MPLLYSQQLAGQASRPIIKPTDPAYGGRLFRFRSTINLAAIATTTFGSTQVAAATADWIQLLTLPSGYVPDFGMITSSVSLGTSVVAIGTNAVHASNGQYRAAGTFTAVDTPTLFGLASMSALGAVAIDTPVFLTIATASLPSAGTLVVDIYANKP